MQRATPALVRGSSYGQFDCLDARYWNHWQYSSMPIEQQVNLAWCWDSVLLPGINDLIRILKALCFVTQI